MDIFDKNGNKVMHNYTEEDIDKMEESDNNENKNGECCEIEDVGLEQHIADTLVNICDVFDNFYSEGIDLNFKKDDPLVVQLKRIADVLENIDKKFTLK